MAELGAKYAVLIIKELVRREGVPTEFVGVPNAPTNCAAPYVLIGASFGSTLAHHVAVAAHARGYPADGLVLIEPPPLVSSCDSTDGKRSISTGLTRQQVCILFAHSVSTHTLHLSSLHPYCPPCAAVLHLSRTCFAPL